MDARLLLPLLVVTCATGCASTGAGNGSGTGSLAEPPGATLVPVTERLPMTVAEVGRPATHPNAHASVDWAQVLGITRDRVQAWPVLRSLRALQPQTFDHLGVDVGRNQIQLTYSTRF